MGLLKSLKSLESLESRGSETFVADSPTSRRVALRDGGEVVINDRATANNEANYRTCKLVVHSDELAEIRPTVAHKLFCGAFSLMGLFFVAGAATQSFSVWADKPWIWYLLGGGLVFFSLLGVVGLIGPRRVMIDRSQGVITVSRGRVPLPELKVGLPLSRLGALQLCSWMAQTERETNGRRHTVYYRMYELNAVLAGGIGERFVLMTDNNLARLMPQAKQLSHMLSLPLINSTGRGGG